MRSAALAVLLGAAALAGEIRAPGAPGGASLTLRLDARKCHYVEPGVRIDVIQVRREKKVWIAEVVLQNALILDARPLETGQAELSLGLGPKDAESYRRALARGGTFTIAARAPGDAEVFAVAPASFERLFQQPRDASPKGLK